MWDDNAHPLSIDELRNMHGLPVWCATIGCYGIISVDPVGTWAGVPFILGVINDSSATFQYNIEKRELECYGLLLP